MKRVTINIDESKYRFFIELLKNFDFVQIQQSEDVSEQTTNENLNKGFEERQDYKEEKLNITSANGFLTEL